MEWTPRETLSIANFHQGSEKASSEFSDTPMIICCTSHKFSIVPIANERSQESAVTSMKEYNFTTDFRRTMNRQSHLAEGDFRTEDLQGTSIKTRYFWKVPDIHLISSFDVCLKFIERSSIDALLPSVTSRTRSNEARSSLILYGFEKASSNLHSFNGHYRRRMTAFYSLIDRQKVPQRQHSSYRPVGKSTSTKCY